MAVIDLSIPLHNNLKLLPNLPKVSIVDYYNFDNTSSLYKFPCHGCTVTCLSMPDHSGTHIDAPIHFIPGGKDISQIPPDYLIGKAIKIDVSSKDNDTPLSINLFKFCLKEQGIMIDKNDIVLIRCSSKKWSDEGFYKIKSLTPEVADYLIEKEVRAVGVDLISVDCLEDRRRPVHLKLLKKEILIIEGLNNLEKIDKKHFQFMALPLPLVSASGSPTRAIAIVK
jgi:arylformamidase